MKHGMVRGAISLGGARVVTNLLNAATLLILARLLTPQDFGYVAIAGAVLNVVISLTQVSIYQALMHHPAATRAHVDTAWTLAFIRTLLILLFFILACWPLSLVYDEPQMIPIFLVCGLTGGVSGLFNPHMNLATKAMRYGPLTIFQIVQKSAGLVVAIILAFIYESYWAIIIGNFVGAASASLLSYFLIPYRPRFTLRHTDAFFGFSGWMFFSQLCETMNWRFDQLAISVMLPPGQVGTYAMADSLAVIPTRETVQPLREALFPGLTVKNTDRDWMARSCIRAQSTISLIVMPLGVGLALVADPAVRVVLGERWLEVVPFVHIFSVHYAVSSLTSMFPTTAMALGETRLNFMMQLWSLVCRIPLILTGLAFGGLYGAALARLASEAICIYLALRYMRSLLGIPIGMQISAHGATLASLAAMIVAVLASQAYIAPTATSPLVQLLVLSLIGGITYCLAAFSIWRICGRSDGPVSEIISIVVRLARHGRKPSQAGV